MFFLFPNIKENIFRVAVTGLKNNENNIFNILHACYFKTRLNLKKIKSKNLFRTTKQKRLKISWEFNKCHQHKLSSTSFEILWIYFLNRIKCIIRKPKEDSKEINFTFLFQRQKKLKYCLYFCSKHHTTHIIINCECLLRDLKIVNNSFLSLWQTNTTSSLYVCWFISAKWHWKKFIELTWCVMQTMIPFHIS